MIKFGILAGLSIVLVTGGYYQGVQNTNAKLTAKYVKQLEKVAIQNQALVKQVALKETEITDRAFEYETRIDDYVANVRTHVERVYISPKKTSVSENESTECADDEASRVEIPPRILEASAELTRDYNRVVKQLMICQNYVKQNLEAINNER